MPSASSPAEPSPVRQVGAVWVGIGGCSSLDPPYGKTNLELSFPGDANLHFTSTSEVTLFGALPNRHPRDGANTNCWDASRSCSCTPQQHQVRRQNGSCQLFLCVLSSHPSDLFFFFHGRGEKKPPVFLPAAQMGLEGPFVSFLLGAWCQAQGGGVWDSHVAARGQTRTLLGSGSTHHNKHPGKSSRPSWESQPGAPGQAVTEQCQAVC